MRNAYKALVGRHEWNRPLARRIIRRKDEIKIDLK